MTGEEVDQEAEVFALAVILAFFAGRWSGRRAERQDLFRIIRAQRTTQAQEQ